ncbi:MAG: hypothetical protein ACYCPF_13310 [Streptosporangiaceae bacterium]
MIVSRGTSYRSDGSKACARCGRRRDRGPGQAYCRRCHTEYMRQWRAGRVEMLLSPEEAAAIRALREVGGSASGRHRAG